MRVSVPRDSGPEIYDGEPKVLVVGQALTVQVGTKPGERVFLRISKKELQSLLKEKP